jgi:hypothetical protein
MVATERLGRVTGLVEASGLDVRLVGMESVTEQWTVKDKNRLLLALMEVLDKLCWRRAGFEALSKSLYLAPRASRSSAAVIKSFLRPDSQVHLPKRAPTGWSTTIRHLSVNALMSGILGAKQITRQLHGFQWCGCRSRAGALI